MDDANAALAAIQAKQADFAAISTQTIGSCSYTSSLNSLNNIGSKYDSSANAYIITNPTTGSQDFKIDIRTGWAGFASYSSPIKLQRDIYVNKVCPGMAGLPSAAKDAASPSMVQNVRNSLTQVTDFINRATDIQSNIVKYTGYGDDYVSAVQIAFTVYYAIVLGCGCAMLAGTILFVFCNWAKCKCISHLGWCVIALLMILGFLLSTLLFPFSVILIEGCDMIKLSNLQAGDKGVIPDGAWEHIRVCFAGNGDLYTKYNLNTQIAFAMNATNAFSLINDLWDNDNSRLRYNITDSYLVNVKAFIYILGYENERYRPKPSLPKYYRKSSLYSVKWKL